MEKKKLKWFSLGRRWLTPKQTYRFVSEYFDYIQREIRDARMGREKINVKKPDIICVRYHIIDVHCLLYI